LLAADPIALRIVFLATGALIILLGFVVQWKRARIAVWAKENGWGYAKMDLRVIERVVRVFGFALTLVGLLFAVL